MRALLLPLVAFFLLAIEAGVSPYPAAGVGFTVDSTTDAVDANPGDGVCASEAGECTLRAAVQETNALAGADEITLPAGTYELTTPGRGEDAAATGDLDITDDLTITGSSRDTTIIDGGQLDRIFHASLFFHNELQVDLSDLTIRNGKAELVPGVFLSMSGGGILLDGGVSATLTDMDVEANDALGFAGGIWVGSAFASVPPSSVDLVRVDVAGNSAGEGGGVHNSGNITLTDGVISSNSAAGTAGGIDNDASLAIRGSRIEFNEAANVGGISNAGSSVFTMADSEITGNVAAGSAGGADAAGTTSITGSTISDNTAAGGEGGGLFVWGTTAITNTTLSGNSAGTDGGAVYVWVTEGPGLTVTNSTISGNSADREGGGIFVLVGTMDLANVTVAYNAAGEEGGVAVSDAPVTRAVGAVNTIFSKNTPRNCAEPINSEGHNLEDMDSCGLAEPSDRVNADPLLLPLGDYGGPSLTHALPKVHQTDAISPVSAAIDAGDDAVCPQTDQRGSLRPEDGDDDGVARCDIGAYEAPQGFVCKTGCPPSGSTPTPARCCGVPGRNNRRCFRA